LGPRIPAACGAADGGSVSSVGRSPRVLPGMARSRRSGLMGWSLGIRTRFLRFFSPGRPHGGPTSGSSPRRARAAEHGLLANAVRAHLSNEPPGAKGRRTWPVRPSPFWVPDPRQGVRPARIGGATDAAPHSRAYPSIHLLGSRHTSSPGRIYINLPLGSSLNPPRWTACPPCCSGSGSGPLGRRDPTFR
jgi:hypothetical protein